MIRIKIPYGKLTTAQLRKIADISDEYASGILHATTRQDIQIHYVSLDRTPELWARLEAEQITLREACGNTVRNITASARAGIDPDEPFDVSPYAQALFTYFLRNPVCQEMGRKFKIAFSSSDKDSAFVFIHDLGFIPKVIVENGKEVRGFKVLVGGGLGAIPYLAQTATDFLLASRLVPFTESLLRVYDRYGERTRRQKARIKFLIQELGVEKLLELVRLEETALPDGAYAIDVIDPGLPAVQQEDRIYPEVSIKDARHYQRWLDTNVFQQKQDGFHGVFIKVPLGNLSSDTARSLADIVDFFAADDIRITINQGYLLKFIRAQALPGLYLALGRLGLNEPGFDSPADITACPGTDTCNLGISSSTGIADALSNVIRSEYPDLIYNNDIKIKISGCPNSCGQHGLAGIGFHGSSMKMDGQVLPALQVVLGGGVEANGSGRISEKVIKIPSKRGPHALRTILDDYADHSREGEYYKDYYVRMGKMYFYHLLKPIALLDDIGPDDFIDWGRDIPFQVQTEVGECAGVIIDLVSTLFFDSEEKLENAGTALKEEKYGDAVYHSYSAFINSAKALLLQESIRNNSQMDVISNFDKHFVDPSLLTIEGKSFRSHVLKMKDNKPTKAFAQEYLQDSLNFLEMARQYKAQVLNTIER